MALTAVPFSNFAFGEYGSQSPFGVGFAIFRQHLLYRGWWTGQNMVRPIAGGLCPRAGEKPYVLTGVPNGAITAMGAGLGKVWFVVNHTVYQFDPTNFTSQPVQVYTGDVVGDLGDPTQPGSWVDKAGTTYLFSAYGGAMVKLNHLAKTVTAIVGAPAAQCCTVFGDRAVAANGATLNYSAAGNYESWPAANYLTVGDSQEITSLDTLRTRLAIGKVAAFGDPWFVLSGVPGFNDVLRQAEVSLAARHGGAAVDMGEGVGLLTDVEGTLAVFDGTRLRPLPYLAALAAGADLTKHQEYSVFRLRRPGEWGAVAGPAVDGHDAASGSIWLYRNGAWSRHKRATPTTGVTTGGFSVSVPSKSLVVFAQGGDASHGATFCALNPYLERPPFTSDAGTTILDPALCLFTLPEWWARDATEVAVAAVEVDLVSYNTGDTNPNTLTCNAVAMRTYDPQGTYSAGGGDKSTPPNQTYTESPAVQSTSGSRKRVTLQYPPVWGNGFRLDFSNLRGVTVEKVVALLDERPTPGI